MPQFNGKSYDHSRMHECGCIVYYDSGIDNGNDWESNHTYDYCNKHKLEKVDKELKRLQSEKKKLEYESQRENKFKCGCWGYIDNGAKIINRYCGEHSKANDHKVSLMRLHKDLKYYEDEIDKIHSKIN